MDSTDKPPGTLEMGCFVDEIGIEDGHGGHGLNDGYGAGQDTRVMTTAGMDGDGLAVDVNGLLRTQKGGNRFESYAEGDGLTVGNASLNAAAVIGGEPRC